MEKRFPIREFTTTNAGSTDTLVGIARFRLFGTAVPVFSSDPDAIIELTHVSSADLAISYTDQKVGACLMMIQIACMVGRWERQIREKRGLIYLGQG